MKTFRFVSIVMIITMFAGLSGSANYRLNGLQFAQAEGKVEPIAIGAMPMAGVHLVPPSRSGLDLMLADKGLPIEATQAQRAAAEKTWFERFQKQSDTWINPKFQAYVNEREKQLGGQPHSLNLPANLDATTAVPVTATVFAMAVDFSGTDTFTIPVNDGYEDDGTPICVDATTTIKGPMVGNVPAPEADDNFTLWYTPAQTINAKFYEKIIFGYEGAGRARMDLIDPDDSLPGINLAGYTVQDYFDHVAGDGNVTITGTVEGWVTVPHSEGYYGADNCAADSNGGGAGVPVVRLVIDAVEAYKTAHPTSWTDPNFWPKYDANHDGILDTFWIIHAGMGQEAGGGVEGTFAIWSHSSDLRYYNDYPDGYKVYEGDTATTADDIYIGPYTMQPEMAETGVFAEEFGHNFFGLPDLYVSDASNSIGYWNIMSGGAWNGWLGGTAPASMPLWFKMIAAAEVDGQYVPLNWHLPIVTRNYDDPSAEVQIGQLEKTAAGVNKGVRVNLPSIKESIANEAGEGPGAYSGTGRNGLDITLTKQIPIPAGAAGVLSFDAYWEIEEDWDYGYVMVNGAIIKDTTGYFRNTNPNGNNLGWGLTGVDEDTLKFDLSALAGTTVELKLRYKTDAAATEAGWWVDNLMLDGALLDDFATVSGPGTFPGWTNSDPGWYTVPAENTFNNYYLVEWRSKTKYDKMMKTAYIFNDDDTVSRIPYNIPAALIYYRNTKYSATYAQRGNDADPPSLGSKYQLLIVDQNWKALRLMQGTTYVGAFTGRQSAYDAGLTLQPSQAVTVPSVNGAEGVITGPFNFDAKPAVTHFNDTLGYYGGYYFGTPCPIGRVCLVEAAGSAVIPARGLYSTRIANFNYNPIYGLYGIAWDPSWLGSGNPGDDNVQHGVNIKLLSKTGDDAFDLLATLRFYNYSVDFLGKVVSHQVTQKGITAKYQLNIQNIGKEDAANLYLEWALATGQQILSINISGPKDIISTASSQQANTAMDGIALLFPKLPAGQEIVVTVDTFTPATLATGVDYLLSTTISAGDGQIDRGPYWVDVSGEAGFSFAPIIVKASPAP